MSASVNILAGIYIYYLWKKYLYDEKNKIIVQGGKEAEKNKMKQKEKVKSKKD